MIHTKIAHAGIRVNVGRARTMGKRKATRWDLCLATDVVFFYLERRAGHHVHPPIINSECGSLIAPPRLQQRRRGQGPRPQPPPRASPSSDQRDNTNTTMDRASMYHAVGVGNIIPHLCSLASREPQAPRQASERREARDARRKTQRHSTPHSRDSRQQTTDSPDTAKNRVLTG
eukprot:scaffold7642_cov143-Isochrysis_galbana.AAC.1